jgi:hypothetical protein
MTSVAQPLLYKQEIARVSRKSVHSLLDGIHRGRKSIAVTPVIHLLKLALNTPTVKQALSLIKKEGEDPEALLHRLQDAETADFDTFKASTNFRFDDKWKISEGVTAQQFYHDSVYCHTARLPAQARYKGHIFDKERDEYVHRKPIVYVFTPSSLTLLSFHGPRATQ